MAAFRRAKARKLASLTNAWCNRVGDARDGLSPRHAHLKNKNGHRSDRFVGAVAGRMYEPNFLEKAESICLSISEIVSVFILCGSMVSVKL